MPNLDQDGKLILRDVETLSLSSLGSGAFFQSLKKNGVLGHMKSNGIKYIQVVNISYSTADLMNPWILGSMQAEQGRDQTDMVVEVFESNSLQKRFHSSTIVRDAAKNQFVYLDEYWQNVLGVKSSIFMPSLCSYLRLSFLENACTTESAKLFA